MVEHELPRSLDLFKIVIGTLGHSAAHAASTQVALQHVELIWFQKLFNRSGYLVVLLPLSSKRNHSLTTLREWTHGKGKLRRPLVFGVIFNE